MASNFSCGFLDLRSLAVLRYSVCLCLAACLAWSSSSSSVNSGASSAILTDLGSVRAERAAEPRAAHRDDGRDDGSGAQRQAGRVQRKKASLTTPVLHEPPLGI